MPDPAISVIVCTYNRVSLLKECLEALSTQSMESELYEIIVVDNNSNDGTKDFTRTYATQHANTHYVLETRQGLSHARNRGLREARGKYVAYIDDDARADSAWVERILAAFENVRPTPAAVGGKIVAWFEAPPPTWFEHRWETRTWGEVSAFLEPPRAMYGFSGSNMAFQKEVLEQYGGFDPELGMRAGSIGLGEDSALFSQLHRDNLPLWYDPEIVVHHFVPCWKMRMAYRFRRAYTNGYALARIGGRHNVKGTLAAVAMLMWLLALFPIRFLRARGPWKRRFLVELAPVASELGRMSHFLMPKETS